MRRSSEAEGVDDESELVFSLLRAYSEDLEHPLLDLGLMDPDGTSAEFGAVQHEIICIRAYPFEVFLPVAVEPVHMLRLRGGERMVHRIEAVVLVAPFEKREVHYPQRCEYLRVAESEPVAHLDTEHSEHGLDLAYIVAGHHQHEVSGLGSGCLGDGLEVFWGVELVDRGLGRSVGVELDVDQALCTYLRPLDPLGELIGLLAGVVGGSRDCDGANVLGSVEDCEALSLDLVRNLVDGHPETDIRLV